MTAQIVPLAPAAASTRPDPRAELRRLIGEQKTRETEIEKLEETLQRARSATYRAEEAITECNAALGKAKADQAQSLAKDLRGGGIGAGDLVMVRKCRERLTESEDHLAATQAARRELESEIQELSKESHRYRFARALADVLAPDAEALLARAIASRMSFRAQKAALAELIRADLLAPHLREKVRGFVESDTIIVPSTHRAGHAIQAPAPDRGIGDFQDALCRLRTDADVVVPVL